jgi:predicted permease
MGMLWQDIRYGVRMLRKNPGFTAVAVLTLALGIGANTAIFTLIEALLLKSLPVKAPQQLALVTVNAFYGHNASLSYPLYEQWREGSQSFSGLFAAAHGRYRMTVDGAEDAGAGRVGAQAVSGNFFHVLGVPAVLGRTLTPEDDRPGSPQPVAVLSHGFWQRRFGLDPAVIGKTIRLEDTVVTIVGVTPRGFYGFEPGSRPDLWLPMQATPLVEGEGRTRLLESMSSQWLQIMGRLKPSVNKEQARAELDVNYQRLLSEQAAPMSEKDRQQFLQQRIELETGGTGYSQLRWEYRRPLLVLMAIVGLVLLVACANLAGLLLARGTARGREFGVRAALGAGRFALIRQLTAESLLLALAGGVLGLLVAHWGAQLLAHYTVPSYGTGVLLDLRLDLRVLAFTFVISALAGVLFGLLPAWRSSRLDLTATLKSQTGLAGGEGGQFWNKVLVVSQIAVTCCLLIGAGLFVRTVQNLKSLDLGLNRDNLLTFHLDLGKGYDVSQRMDFFAEVLRRVESLPGVRSACCSSIQSLGGSESGWSPSKVVPQGSELNIEEGLEVRATAVTVNYFATMGIPLLRGRAFGPQDEPVDPTAQAGAAPRPAIIDETMARKLFGEENPVGQFLRGDYGPPLEVIGVARDVIHKGLRGGPRLSLYSMPAPNYRRVLDYFHARTVGNPLAMAGAIRQVVRELDPKVEVTELQTMADLVNNQLFRERSLSNLVGFFSLLALVLACLGLYGTLSYSVIQRTREIGVRMALGAQKHSVLAGVIRQGMALTLVGCGLGVILAGVLTRLVSSLLYGVTPIDPVTFVLTVLLLGGVALVSCWLPARRAVKIDPMKALRCE